MITHEQVVRALDYVNKKHGIYSNSENLQEMTQSVMPSWRQRTRTGADFVHNYHPKHSRTFFAGYNIQKSLCGDIPTLEEAAKAYTQVNVETWMMTLLTNLCEYMGYASMPNKAQAEGLAQQFLAKYPFLKVTEVMYYFERIKEGLYYDATVKLEPTKLIKGVIQYMSELNGMKERWGNYGSEFTPEQLKSICLQLLLSKDINIKDYHLPSVALLFGYYYPVPEETYRSIKNKVLTNNYTWVYDLCV